MSAEWWERGLCQWADPEIFDQHPRSEYMSHDEDKWAEARLICRECPVKKECLEWVLSMPREVGSDQSFAAGYTPRQLDKMRARRGKKKVPVNTPLHDPSRWNR